MITLWSVVAAFVAGIDLGYSLFYFIKDQNFGSGILWAVLFVFTTISSVSSIIRRGRQLRIQEEEE